MRVTILPVKYNETHAGHLPDNKPHELTCYLWENDSQTCVVHDYTGHAIMLLTLVTVEPGAMVYRNMSTYMYSGDKNDPGQVISWVNGAIDIHKSRQSEVLSLTCIWN